MVGKRRAAAPVMSVRGVNYSTSPLLASKTPLWRSQMVLLMVALAFMGMVAKAVYVQVVNPEFFQEESAKRNVLHETVPASRGRILDRSGRLLAVSVSAPTVFVSPKRYLEGSPKPEKVAQLLKLLDLSPTEFKARLDKGGAYVPLRKQVHADLASQVRKLRIEGVDIDPLYVRKYPEGESTTHVVGWADKGNVGQEGLEWTFNRTLGGVEGSRTVVRDRIGQIIDEIGDPSEPRPGADLELTIDSQLQALAYQQLRDAVTAHNAKSGSVVVLDARSGEVLAMSNYPSYVPGARTKVSPLASRNRALTDANEPGSTMKPFIVGLAIEKGLARPDQVLDTSPFKVSDRLISDHEHGHASLTVAQVVQKSSNPGTVRLALRLPDREMHDMFSALGFGRKPNLGLPDTPEGRKMLGSATGRLRPWQKWREVEKATMSYGYGISVSLLQLARAYTALAGNGTALPLSLIKGHPGGTPEYVFTPETARTMREMLRGTISAEGTAVKAQPVGYTAAGKTGTAQKMEGRGYSSSRHCAWFAGFAPAVDPRVVVAVMIDEPVGAYYGGLVAAPVFKGVVEHALRMLAVPPDMDIKPTVVAQADVVGNKKEPR